MNDQSDIEEKKERKMKSTLICKTCGTKVRYIAIYCPNCGKDLRSKS